MRRARCSGCGLLLFIRRGTDAATLVPVDMSEARNIAFGFLHRDGDRWLHVQAVAARADGLRSAVAAEDEDLLVAAAWLHDIGYSPVLRDTGFHPLDGARYLASLGHEREAELVAHHSGARFVAEVRELLPELAQFPFTESALTDAQTRSPAHGANASASPIGSPGRFAGTARTLPPRVRHHGVTRTSTPPPSGPRDDCGGIDTLRPSEAHRSRSQRVPVAERRSGRSRPLSQQEHLHSVPTPCRYGLPSG